MSATSFYNKSADSVISSAFSDDLDSFIVGDRVWVQGTKPGYIQYIGEVQFAKGEWAGVVLDKLEGKNDGSVHGVRYFQCEPYRGLFTRLHRLSRFPLDLNGNRLPIEDGLVKTRRVCTPDGKITTTVTRVTKGPASIPHYALPTRPARVITTVTTTTTTSVQKPKSVLKSTCRITSNNGNNNTHHVHF